jgi:hypothetical protein
VDSTPTSIWEKRKSNYQLAEVPSDRLPMQIAATCSDLEASQRCLEFKLSLPLQEHGEP